MKATLLLASLLTLALSNTAGAQDNFTPAQDVDYQESNFLEELDPNDPHIEEILELYDEYYESATGKSAHIGNGIEDLLWNVHSGCYRSSCRVWAHVNKTEQKLYLYLDGRHVDTWLVSTGVKGYGTPDFDGHPNGRIYDRYSSTKYPGGDWNGLGNMPYAVFYYRGFAIHGTPQGNWKRLGTPASHGCTRVHPDNGQYFNRLVRDNGIRNVWITVSW